MRSRATEAKATDPCGPAAHVITSAYYYESSHPGGVSGLLPGVSGLPERLATHATQLTEPTELAIGLLICQFCRFCHQPDESVVASRPPRLPATEATSRRPSLERSGATDGAGPACRQTSRPKVLRPSDSTWSK